MLIRLIPPSPHPTVLYALTFPSFLPLHDISPSATIPAAWSSQLQIITSILQLDPPSSIHMLDRAVGLVARVRDVSMDVPGKEIVVKFVDGRETSLPMNSDCVRMLLDVVLDVKSCTELDSQRSSMEGSACSGTIPTSTDELASGAGPVKSPKLGKHKRQRSLLFSLISSLVPKSFSLSSHSPPSTAPPPAPLPPLPAPGPVTPTSPRQATFPSAAPDPDLLRKRARATLVDVWRRHVISALAPQHLPAAGYLEWTLIAMASKVRAEIESDEATGSRGFTSSITRAVGSRHLKTQSEGRNALDFGDRSDDRESDQWRCRAPSPFPGMFSIEETDQVVYPRREQADEWGVRYVHPRFEDADVFAVEYTGHNESLLEEHFTVGDEWDDNERLTFELGRMGRHSNFGINGSSSSFDDKYRDNGFYCCDGDESRLEDTALDTSACPLIPSDVNDDEESDDSQISLRTPEDGDVFPLAFSVRTLQGSTNDTARSALSPVVSRVSSSRPRSRNASAQFSGSFSASVSDSCFSAPSPHPCSNLQDFDSRDPQLDEFIVSRFEYLERICAALEIVRSRAREEGWGLIRATLIGSKNGWMDVEAERSLEIKAKRRAWSSGIKISAPYPTLRSSPKVWDGTFSILRSPMKPPGLASPLTGMPPVRGPIVPTGMSLGIPLQSSPLAMYAWSADDKQASKYGILSSVNSMETMQGKRSSRVTFADSVTKLFPVCEDENEDLFEPTQADAIGFPEAVPLPVSVEQPEDLIEGPTENEDDPFYFYPPRPRTRTTSMYVNPPTSATSSSPILPMFRPSTPPPSYQTAVGGTNDEGRLDTSSLLLQPLSSLSVSSSQWPSPRPSPVPNFPIVPRPRAVSLPTPKTYSRTNKSRRTSLHREDEHVEDLSRVYASPPPEGPLVVSATQAPHEQYPRYAHVHSPPAPSKTSHVNILGRTGKEVTFEQAGSGFTVGIEVALGRAEEGRVVW